MLTADSDSDTVALADLTFLAEDDHVVVGRRDIDSYAVFPPDGAALLHVLAEGRSLAAAAAWYEDTYGESVDIDAFVTTLAELEFLRGAGEERDDDGGRAASGDDRAIAGRRLGAALFSPPAWVAYAALVVAAVAIAAAHPWLRPSPSHVLFCGSLLIVELGVVAGQALLALVHEAFHVLAGRRLGLRTRVRVSRRLYYVVYETILDGLVTVPRAKRYLPILAGLVADVVAVAALTLLAAALHGGGAHAALAARICLALAVTTVPRIAWQFYFYLETDVYHLIGTVLGTNDLQRAARHVIARRLGRAHGDAGLDPRDLRVARWYAPVLVAGYLLSAVTIVLVLAPLAWQFAGHLAGAIGGARGSAHRWDAAVVLALTALQLAVALAIAVRDRRARRHSPPPTTAFIA